MDTSKSGDEAELLIGSMIANSFLILINKYFEINSKNQINACHLAQSINKRKMEDQTIL